ncbi:MAG: TrkH family potassium uptake protein [Firmicutes bacterium]|nr:TrkH family potassium uptake protein [Bacillota bacterium]
MDHVFRSVIRICALMLIIVGAALLLTFVVSVLSGQWRDGLCFLILGAAIGLMGIISRILCRSKKNKLQLGDGFLIVLILWILMSAAGAVPYLATGTISDPASAFFESCSGFTTTGATVLDSIRSLPHGIVFWRSMTSWLGGVGILLIAITLMPTLSLNGQRLNTPEHYGPVLEKVSPRMVDGIRTIIFVYTGMTFAETILLTASGMSLFNALIHSMSTVSTGGFCRYDEGIAHFDGLAVPLIITCFMILSGLNYNLLLTRRLANIRMLVRNSELRLYAVLLAASFGVIVLALIGPDRTDPGRTVCDALFQSASFLTTTGFVSADYGSWPQIAQGILLFLMFCGACTASPGGGIKVARLAILLKLVRHGISTRLHANFLETIKMNGQGLAADTVSGTATMPFLYLSALFAGVFLLTFGDVSLAQAFNAAISCLCNTGHALGDLGQGASFASFGAPSKCLLSLLMIGGRLELYAIVIVLSPKYWTQSH